MTPAIDFLDLEDQLSEIYLFREYLQEMEEFLHARIQQLTPHPDQPHPESEHDYYQLEMLNHFTNTLRKSFFVIIYGFLESRLVTECRKQKEGRDDITLKLSDLAGQRNSIIKSKTYLTKVLKCGFSFGNSNEWPKIQEYRELRNSIVHNEGKVEKSQESKLPKFIDCKATLSLRNGGVSLHKGFCEEAVDVIERFLTSLLLPDDTNG